jgi:8-oxo-dGTP diphosphatase
MADSGKGRAAIMAAGGIVFRHTSPPLIAVVRPRKERAWILPKGKLKPGEEPIAAARREAVEETGCDVSVHEFLGAMSYPVGGRIKIVQFWRMRALGRQARALPPDIRAVKWLPLDEAIDILTRERERVFLENVGPVALKAARLSMRHMPLTDRSSLDRAPAPAARRYRRPSSLPLVRAVREWFGAAGRQSHGA